MYDDKVPCLDQRYQVQVAKGGGWCCHPCKSHKELHTYGELMLYCMVSFSKWRSSPYPSSTTRRHDKHGHGHGHGHGVHKVDGS